jgi:hypothetical protein
MPQRNRIFLRALLPVSLLVMAILAIVNRKPDEWEYEQAEEEARESAPLAERATTRRRPAARFALAAAFSTLFFAGAAFTAGAGDQAARILDEDSAALEAPETVASAEAAAPAAEPAAPEAPAPEPAHEAAAPPAAAPEPAEAAEAEAPAPKAGAAPQSADAEPAAEPAPSVAPAAAATEQPAEATSDPAPSNAIAPTVSREPAAAPATKAPARPAPALKPRPTKKWIVRRAAAPPAQAPEVEHENHGGHATIWLNRALPDPTPASARLTRRFAKQLASASKRHNADWAAVLGVLRAQGERGAEPATARELDTLAARMAGTSAWKGALALSGRTGFADRAAAFADLYRFAGIEALVTGYAAAKSRLAHKLLTTEGVLIYGGGRTDIQHGRIDIRVIVLIGYLAERHGSVTVSSLFSGHRMFSRPGVVSAHMYGHAVDVAAVGGTPIAGNQQPGGLTEAAVRSVLLLPGELQPQQVISLLGLGGPSFPMRDHGDHIHIGY